jgi:hypothetical protein
MKWLLIAGGILVLLILVVVVIGAALPRDHVATGQVRVKASRTDVWQSSRTSTRFQAGGQV